MGDKSKEMQWKKAWSYINIEHKTEKSNRSSLQGAGTEQDKYRHWNTALSTLIL